MRRRDEAGQTTIMIVGFAVVLMMTIVVVVDASAAYLQRQGLDNVADGAALAGADAMFMDDAFLHAVVRPCLRDIAPRAALRCVDIALSTLGQVHSPGPEALLRELLSTSTRAFAPPLQSPSRVLLQVKCGFKLQVRDNPLQKCVQSARFPSLCRALQLVHMPASQPLGALHPYAGSTGLNAGKCALQQRLGCE